MKYFYPYDKSLYFPAQKMKFEDIEVYVPNQAERHCEIEYGDWHWISEGSGQKIKINEYSFECYNTCVSFGKGETI